VTQFTKDYRAAEIPLSSTCARVCVFTGLCRPDWRASSAATRIARRCKYRSNPQQQDSGNTSGFGVSCRFGEQLGHNCRSASFHRRFKRCSCGSAHTAGESAGAAPSGAPRARPVSSRAVTLGSADYAGGKKICLGGWCRRRLRGCFFNRQRPCARARGLSAVAISARSMICAPDRLAQDMCSDGFFADPRWPVSTSLRPPTPASLRSWPLQSALTGADKKVVPSQCGGRLGRFSPSCCAMPISPAVSSKVESVAVPDKLGFRTYCSVANRADHPKGGRRWGRRPACHKPEQRAKTDKRGGSARPGCSPTSYADQFRCEAEFALDHFGPAPKDTRDLPIRLTKSPQN